MPSVRHACIGHIQEDTVLSGERVIPVVHGVVFASVLDVTLGSDRNILEGRKKYGVLNLLFESGLVLGRLQER